MAEKSEEKEARQIVPHVSNEEMFVWLEGVFNVSPRTEAVPKAGEHKPKSEPDNFPERIELRTVAGRGANLGSGNIIWMKEYKAQQSPIPSREQLVMLANEFERRAQGDCDGLRHHQRYGLFAFSSLKGASYYERFLFAMFPNLNSKAAGGISRMQGIGANDGMSASDDEDTHKDRLLSTALAHARWQQEQYTEAVSGVLKLQQQMIVQQQETIIRQEGERRSWILAAEEALSKKDERDRANKWADMKIAVLGEMWNSVKGLLPAVAIHLTKGKSGIVEGIQAFLESLSEDAKAALFGVKSGDTWQLGVLEREQAELILSIADRTADPKRITEFVMSLQPHQMARAQEVLSPTQIQSLMAIAKAASSTSEANGAQA